MRNRIAFAGLVITLILVFSAAAQAELTDPYEILSKYYDAIGGLDALKAQTSSRVEGEVDIVGTGLKGTFVNYAMDPNRSRQDVDLGIFKQQSGDNGKFPWSVDHNGKLQIIKDEVRLKDGRVDSLMSEFEHLNKNSPYFTLTYEGIDTASGKDCYVVKIANNISETVNTQYINTTDFLLIKQITNDPRGEQHSTFSDYRKVGDILTSFRQDVWVPDVMQKQIVQITKVETNIPIDESLFEPPGEDIEDFRFANGRDALDIPFEFIENHIYFPIEIGGKMTLWVLDTGASITVVNKWFADELGLKIEGNIKGMGAGNLVDVSFTEIPAFKLPGLEFDKQKVAVIDINWLFRQWIGMDVAGILGYDFLSRMVTKVDYANQKISFYHPDNFTYKGFGTVLDIPLTDDNNFHPDVIVDGTYEGTWNLDLGAGGLSFHYPYALEQGFLDKKGIMGMGFGAGGSSMHQTQKFNQIEFAGYTVANPLISMPLEKGEGGFGSSTLAGNLGNTLFRNFIIYLDYAHEKLIVEKGADFGKKFPTNNSGLNLILNDENKLAVLYVSPGTPGEKAGLAEGDIITAVNGIKAEYLGGILALQKMIKEPPGTKYEITVDRNGETKTLKLVLKDLYH